MRCELTPDAAASLQKYEARAPNRLYREYRMAFASRMERRSCKMLSETVSVDERRAYARYAVSLALQIDAERRSGRVGIVRNGSAGGLLFETRSRFKVDEKIEMTVLLPKGLAVLATGRVVRIRELAIAYPWRFVVAAEFDAASPILGDVLRTLTRS